MRGIQLHIGMLMALALILLAGCTKSLVGKGAAVNEKEDVISLHGMQVKNREKLDDWLEQGSGRLRVVHYTIEGDPIFYTVTRVKGKVELEVDTTQDKFGAPQVSAYSCADLSKKETETSMLYTLTACTGAEEESGHKPQPITLLEIQYDVEAQDRFEFTLKYGPGLNNVIDTMKQSVDIDLQDGRRLAISDFQLSKEQRQAVYKQLVLANYLGEKKLVASCKGQRDESYDLRVLINGGEANLKWAACDTSPDGKQLTAIARDIVAIVKKYAPGT